VKNVTAFLPAYLYVHYVIFLHMHIKIGLYQTRGPEMGDCTLRKPLYHSCISSSLNCVLARRSSNCSGFSLLFCFPIGTTDDQPQHSDQLLGRRCGTSSNSSGSCRYQC